MKEKLSKEELIISKILSDKNKSKHEIIKELLNTDFPYSNIENFDYLFNILIKYKSEMIVNNNYLINGHGKSFFSHIIKPNIDSVPRIIVSHRENTYKPDRLSSLFTEDIRIKSMRNYMKTNPLDMWSNPAFMGEIVEDLFKFNSTNGEISLEKLRQSHEWKTKKCTNFPINVALEIYMFFCPTRILDLSAGWGDRAIAASAWGKISNKQISYTGIDPNPLLEPKYKLMFEKMNENLFKFINEPSESYCYNSSDEYDLIFTSPPYFDLELFYDGNSLSQSIDSYPHLKNWCNDFFLKTFSNAWEKLIFGGNMVIVIEDSMGTKDKKIFTEYCILSLIVILDFNRFRGVISYSGGDVYRPMFCFEKIKYNDISCRVNAQNDLKKYWKDLLN